MLEILQAEPQLRFRKTEGAFYSSCATPFFGEWRGGRRIGTSAELAEHLLENHGIAVVPGSAFDNDSSIRLSYTLPEAPLRRGLEQLVAVLQARS